MKNPSLCLNFTRAILPGSCQPGRSWLALAAVFLLSWHHESTAAVTVTVNRTNVIATSQYYSAMSQIDNSLDYPYGSNNGAAVTNARTLMAQGISFGNNHIQAWGVSDPWPDPASPEPTVWGGLDKHLSIIVNAGCTPMITLCEAPWWMKGQYQTDGSTKLIPSVSGEWDNYTYTNGITDFRGLVYAPGYVSPDPYSSRVIDSQMSKWLQLVQRTAERYMVPPYNVRYFQVWNELKGYNNPALNRWQYENTAGNTNGYNASHGYTFMYNQVYKRLTNTAGTLGIPVADLYIGGPYPVMDSGSSSTNVGGWPSTVTGPWGVMDRRPLDVVKYWLTNNVGAGFVCMDGGNGNKFGGEITDQFTRCEKFSAVNNWIRQQVGGATLPLVWSEWYSSPTDFNNTNLCNALGAYSASQQILSGASLTLLWGGELSAASKPPLWTSTAQVGGGQPFPWYYTYKTLDQKFGFGNPLFQTTSSSTNVGVLATTAYTMLINKTSNSLAVTLDGTALTLNGYEVRFVDVPPAAPAGLSAITVSSSQINLSWTDTANNESGFRIERKTGAGGTYAQIGTATTNATSFGDSGLSPNTTYYYHVCSTNIAGASAFSTEASATTLPLPPAAPSSLSATTISATEIDLAWTDNASNETGFKIERKTGAGGTYAQIGTVGANVTTYSSTNLTANTSYYYRVRANNTGGDSTYSNEANDTTLPLPPSAPSGLGATAASYTQINLAWTDNANNETGFKIEQKLGVGGTYAQIATVGANVTSYSDTNLTGSTTYYYRVRAYNTGGDSAYSAEANATTLQPPPAAPSALVVTSLSTNQAKLAWTDNATNETTFKIERKLGTGGTYAQIATVGANVTTYTNTGLPAGTLYLYRISATNSSGASAYCAEVAGGTDGLVRNTTSSPAIDGNVDANWSLAPAYSITNTILGTISGSSDLSGTYQTLWDASNLYVLVTVTDNVRTNDSGTATWDDDSVEIYLDADNSKSGTFGANDYQYSFRWNDTTFKEAKHNATNGVTFAKVDTGTGYRMEIKFPWTTLGATAAPGLRVGLEVQINDDDDGGTRDGKAAWWGTSDTAYNNPSTFGTVQLDAVNLAPTVSITTPTNNAVLNTGIITITASASDTDGNISKVEFYEGANLIGTDTSSPFTITWTNNTASTYSLTARATDDSGAVTTSSAISITTTTDALLLFTGTAPTIDGNVDAGWNSASSYPVTNVIIGSVSSSADLSGTFQTMWDANNFYLLVTVTDNVRTNDSGTATYNDDSVEIYIDADNSKSATFGANDYQYTLRWNDTIIKEAKHNATNGVTFAQVNTANGYRMEIKFPWATLGTTPAVGTQIGLEVQINDDDDGGARDKKTSWWGTSDTAYLNPGTWGTGRMK